MSHTLPDSKRATTLFQHPLTAGVLLLFGTAVALLMANSPWGPEWETFWHWELGFELGSWHLSNSLLHWINDGLMALFFFVVGLELKREFMAGSLSSPQAALLPMIAAVGGMVVPALIYRLVAPAGPAEAGWGIPMATDIAFAVGILTLLGSRVPPAVKLFVSALAIADDLGAVLVIALFYTSSIDLWNLGAGIFFLAILIGANRIGVRSPLFYGIVGIGGIWLSFLASGIHASIAGVLIAFTIPARPRMNEATFVERLRKLTDEFLAIPPNKVSLLEPAQMENIQQIQRLTRYADTPLQRIEHAVSPFVQLAVVPLFALANAGIEVPLDSPETWASPVTWGIAFGLLAGKTIGILGSTMILLGFKWVHLPEGMNRQHLVGAALLCGIGFTMSLFITGLAFGEGELAHQAKMGILTASVAAAVLGSLVLLKSKPSSPDRV